MPQHRRSTEHTQRLICPFCGAEFEELAECPEHGLTLVQIGVHELGGSSKRVTFFADPRLGRGFVLLGATLVLVGFVLPFVRSSEIVASALEVAVDGAANLWLTPGAAILLLWILWRRRDAESMRAARVAVFALAAAGALPLVYTCRRVALMADAQGTDLAWLLGLWVMASGLAVAAVGSRALGGR